MFAPSYFGGWYFGRRYFGTGGAIRPDLRKSVILAALASLPLTSVVAMRVYPSVRSQRSALPAVSVRVVSNRNGHSLDGPDGSAVARVEFHVFSRDETDCVNGLKAIASTFDGFSGTLPGGVYVCSAWQDGDADGDEWADDGTDEAVRRISTDYLFHYLYLT